MFREKGEINKFGFLCAEQNGKMEFLECIYKKQTCGDYCVGFGTPQKYKYDTDVSLSLCSLGSIHFNQFEDKRK